MQEVTNLIQALTGTSDPGSLWGIFLVGLTVGGLSNVAVQGGLLVLAITLRKMSKIGETSFSDHALPVLYFILSKLIVFSLLGMILGGLGKELPFLDLIRAIMQVILGLYLLSVALHFLKVHPIFARALWLPPFVNKSEKKKSQKSSIFLPLFLGAMTVFIPGDTTQDLEAFAANSDSIVFGGLTLGAFILGTLPLFFSIGYLASTLNSFFKDNFVKIATLVILYFAIITINGGLMGLNSPITLQKIGSLLPIELDLSE